MLSLPPGLDCPLLSRAISLHASRCVVSRPAGFGHQDIGADMLLEANAEDFKEIADVRRAPCVGVRSALIYSFLLLDAKGSETPAYLR